MLEGFEVLDVSEAQVRIQQGQLGFSSQNSVKQATEFHCEALPLTGYYSQ